MNLEVLPTLTFNLKKDSTFISNTTTVSETFTQKLEAELWESLEFFLVSSKANDESVNFIDPAIKRSRELQKMIEARSPENIQSKSDPLIGEQQTDTMEFTPEYPTNSGKRDQSPYRLLKDARTPINSAHPNIIWYPGPSFENQREDQVKLLNSNSNSSYEKGEEDLNKIDEVSHDYSSYMTNKSISFIS